MKASSLIGLAGFLAGKRKYKIGFVGLQLAYLIYRKYQDKKKQKTSHSSINGKAH